MPPKRIKSKKRAVLITLSVLFGLLVMAMWLLPMIYGKQIETALKEKIVELSGGHYHAEMQDFRLNLFTNSVTASKFELIEDTTKGNRNSLGVYLQAEEIKFSGLNFWKIIFNRTFQLNRIKVQNGKSVFTWHPDRKEQKNLIEKKGGIEHIVLKRVSFINMRVEFINDQKQSTIYSGTTDLKFEGICINRYGFPTVKSLVAGFSNSRFYFDKKYIDLDTTYFEYRHAQLHTRLRNVVFSHETQHILKIFPGSTVQYNFNAKEVGILIKDLSQLESIAKTETKNLFITQIKVERPQLTLYRDTLPPSDSNAVVKTIFPLFVQRLGINDGTFIVNDKSSHRNRIIADGIDMDIRELRPSPEHYLIPFKATLFEIQSDSILYFHKNSLQLTRLINLSLSTDDSLLKCSRLVMSSMVPEDSFFRAKKYQCDLPFVEINEFSLNGIDGDLLLERKYLSAEVASVQRCYLRTIRNKNYDYEPGKKVLMPQDQILGIDAPFYLKKVIIQSGKIDYFEIPDNGNSRGNLWIDKIKIEGSNITNDSSLLNLNDTMEIVMEGYLYSQGLIQVLAIIPLIDETRGHYVYGKIGPFDPGNLNRITENCAQMKIQKGVIHGGEFEFYADKTESNGKLNLLFNKLKMKILTREGNRLTGDNIRSLIANLFITRNNPEKGKEPVIGAIYWRRDSSRWITNYWWKSLFSGINNIVMARRAQLKVLEKNFLELKKNRVKFNNNQ